MLTQRQLFLQHLAQTSDAPLMLEIVSAEGIYLQDASGKKYMDLISGIGVSSVGHRHPKVVTAIKNQLDKYMHLMVYGEFIQSVQNLLAQKLAATFSYEMSSVYFVNSGSEATEGALKLAKRYTGRPEIVYFEKAYHGSTQGALSVNGSEYYKQAYRPLLPATRMIRYGQFEDLDVINEQTAAVILEAVQGEAGVRYADKAYYVALQEHCREKGVLLIADEIQSGFGRTGKFWAFEHFHLQPDIVLTAKAMGGGLPLGAFIASGKLMSVLSHDPALGHITTFGGNPVCCAASLAVMEILHESDLLSEVNRKAVLFIKLLIHPAILEVRCCGLLMAVQFDSFTTVKKVIDQAIELGVLTDWFLHCDNALRIAPPLVITDVEIEEACSRILRSIDQAGF